MTTVTANKKIHTSCYGKVQFATRNKAQRAVHTKEVNVYHCFICSYWHIGSRESSRTKRVLHDHKRSKCIELLNEEDYDDGLEQEMAKTPTIGGLVDAMFLLREEKRTLEARANDLAAQIETLELQLIEVLDAQGTSRGDGKLASVTVSEAVVPTVKDWDALWAWIIKSKNTQLLQNRISPPAWRELCELNKAPPGVESFTKRGIKLLTKRN